MGDGRKEMLQEQENFRIQMQRENILHKLKEQGYRMTKQRIAVIDIILENECGSCKEILYRASKVNRNIGAATIYRTVNMLEEIGAIHRRNIYRLSGAEEMGGAVITLEDGEEIHLTAEEWNEVTRRGLEISGYIKGKRVLSIVQGERILE
ncbi:MAG: transcriptional repressor [Bacillota bacterium]|nr:transcriptional repressor [Bacillota bacterium]